jgi:hypothetical protein
VTAAADDLDRDGDDDDDDGDDGDGDDCAGAGVLDGPAREAIPSAPTARSRRGRWAFFGAHGYGTELQWALSVIFAGFVLLASRAFDKYRISSGRSGEQMLSVVCIIRQ